MNTFRQIAEQFLTDSGLFGDEVPAVMAIVERNASLNKVIDQDSSTYPPAMIKATHLAARQSAIHWLKEHKPEHFALEVLQG